MDKIKEIRGALLDVVERGTPTLSAFAAWVLDHLNDVAFQSIRGLAGMAGVNANTVTRLARELGYDGYDAFRHDVQTLLTAPPRYSERARALNSKSGADIWSETLTANWSNVETLFTPEARAMLESCVEPLLGARRVYSVGVRSCFSVAHYFSYVGAMAFDNFVPVPSMPGAILDQVSASGPEDIIVAITYEHYSSEVVRACQVARETGARILALTDSYRSPIAKGAWKVIKLPMGGPQLMPSLTTAFITAELLLTAMTARSPASVAKVARFEETITSHGGYFSNQAG
ncbi:MurR/RpiR family transcriptional regulator [Thioclava sp. A2]|uniref:MurR/RpiR family transcriptional regulator n=1 Tax=Thioclava sp. FCG-A2 TaxID=3080562 RepID=UPI0029530F80|nr:MurR/RpiR family transcriptional regulator [Thioclava sp. A2]MDV7271651.1 MurR/RpiR family transcriptional regulator [Thioclava sp. A2]